MRGLMLVAALLAATAAPAQAGEWRIAYSASHGLWSRTEAGPPQRIRAGHGFGALAWSPDGRWLAYEHAAPDGVFVTSSDGRETWRVSSTPGRPSWSPNGSRIAIASSDGFLIAAWDGSGARRVLRGRCDAAWAGEQLVAACGRRLVEVAPDGALRLLDRPAQDRRVEYVSGSSDGRLVAFGRHCYDAPVGGDVFCEIAALDLGDGSRRTLVPYAWGQAAGSELDPVWIPGTDRLLVSVWGFAHAVVLVDAATGSTRVVSHRAAVLLAAAADGSFADLEGRALAIRAADGRVLVRIAVPYAGPGGVAALAR